MQSQAKPVRGSLERSNVCAGSLGHLKRRPSPNSGRRVPPRPRSAEEEKECYVARCRIGLLQWYEGGKKRKKTKETGQDSEERNEERQVKGGWIPRCEPEPRAGFGEGEKRVDGGQYGLREGYRGRLGGRNGHSSFRGVSRRVSRGRKGEQRGSLRGMGGGADDVAHREDELRDVVEVAADCGRGHRGRGGRDVGRLGGGRRVRRGRERRRGRVGRGRQHRGGRGAARRAAGSGRGSVAATSDFQQKCKITW